MNYINYRCLKQSFLIFLPLFYKFGIYFNSASFDLEQYFVNLDLDKLQSPLFCQDLLYNIHDVVVGIHDFRRRRFIDA